MELFIRVLGWICTLKDIEKRQIIKKHYGGVAERNQAKELVWGKRSHGVMGSRGKKMFYNIGFWILD